MREQSELIFKFNCNFYLNQRERSEWKLIFKLNFEFIVLLCASKASGFWNLNFYINRNLNLSINHFETKFDFKSSCANEATGF